jgi:hypothetical protein
MCPVSDRAEGKVCSLFAGKVETWGMLRRKSKTAEALITLGREIREAYHRLSTRA